MSASPTPYRKPTTKCVTVLTPLLRHLNTGTLAFFLFVALALLSTIRGKEPETRESAPAISTKTEVVIDNFSFSPKTFTVPSAGRLPWTNNQQHPHVRK